MDRGLNYRITTAANLQGLKALAVGLAQTQRAMSLMAQTANRMNSSNDAAARRIERLSRSVSELRLRLAAARTQTASMKRGVDDLTTSLGFLGRTVRRFLTYLVLFVAMGAVKRSFDQITRAAIGFNKAMEEGSIAMAGIILATGKFADAQGKVLSVSQSLPLAMQAGQRQMKLLQKDALATTGDFQSMAEAMQVAIAPGLQAGMTLDQIRILSRRIAQAATALSMPGQQMPEEIRSLLAGTIRPQTTRIATALGITSDDVRKWKEMGTFTEEVLKRFEAFEKIEQPLGNTMTLLVNRVKDAFQAVAGTAGGGFFQELKKLLKDVFGALTGEGESGLSTGAVQALTGMFKSLEGIVKRIREYINTADLSNWKDIGEAIGTLFGTLGETLFILFENLTLASVFILKAIKNISDAFGGVVKYVADFGVKSYLLLKTWTLVKSAVAGISLFMGKAVTSAALLSATSKTWLTGLTSGLAKVGGVLAGVTLAIPLLDSVLRSAIPAMKSLPSISQAAMTFGKSIFQGAQATGEYMAEVNKGLADAEDAADGVVRKGMVPWKDRVAEIQPLMISTGESLQRQEDAIAKMVKSTEALVTKFSLLRDTSFASGRAGEIQMKMLDAQVDVQTKIKELLSDQQNRISRIQAIDRDILANRQKIEGLGGEHLDEFNKLLKAENARESIQTAMNDLKLREVELQKKLKETEGDTFDLSDKQLADRLDATNELLGVNKKLAVLEGGMAVIRDRTSGLGGRSEAARQAVLKEIELARQRKGAETELNILKEDALGVEEKILEALSLQLAVENTLAAKKIETANLGLGPALTAEQEIFQLQLNRANLATIEAARAKLSMVQAQTQLNLLRSENQQKLQVYRTELAQAKTEQKRESLQKLINAEQMQSIFQEGELLLKLQEATEIMRQQQQIAQGTFGEGLLEGMRQFAQEAPTVFQGGLDVMKSALDAFADLVADTIVDAFDPTADTSLQERIGRFIQDIGRQLLQLAMRMAMAQAITAAFGGGIPANGASALLGSRPPMGLAAGGPVPPAGLPASDTVPIWATPGEFMVKVDAVRKYGSDMLSAINQGLVDPMALRGLRSSRRASRGSSGRMGYAEGGEIAASQMVPVSQPSGVSQAVVVANEETFDQLVTGGKGAMLKFIQKNKSTIKGLLS